MQMKTFLAGLHDALIKFSQGINFMIFDQSENLKYLCSKAAFDLIASNYIRSVITLIHDFVINMI